MQLPALYLRGSIATQTMTNLSEEQRKTIEGIVKEVADDPSLAADKFEFMKQLGATISGDYRSDQNAAYQEFIIAIWRATAHLLYHKDYTYKCNLCESSEYKTSAGKIRQFDRQYKICPNCKKSEIDGNVVDIDKDDEGYFISGDSIDLGPYRSKKAAERKLESPIESIGGDTKVEDPYSILDDSIQRRKWYSVWIWNYFRQILKENIIKTQTTKVEVCGPADIIAFYSILNELKSNKCKYYYDESKAVSGGELDIYLSLMQTPLAFDSFMVGITKEYKNYNIDISWIDFSQISVTSTSKQISMIDAKVDCEDPVIVLSMNSPYKRSGSGQEDSNWSDAVEFNSQKEYNHTGSVDEYISNEALDTIRSNLDSGTTKKIFDILSQKGNTWIEFSSSWGSQTARKIHIAKFLGISAKEVESHKSEIKSKCLSLGIVDR